MWTPSLPTGANVDRTLLASDLKAFSIPCTTLRRDITCFRCGESGHWKNECLHWRTRMCWHMETSSCTRDDCPFAHSPSQLRTPWNLRCIRIIKVNNVLQNIGCGSISHSFRNCPVRTTRY